MEYPCISCGKEVRPRQHAVACDVCSNWQHRTCNTGISQKEYRLAVRGQGELNFVCRNCSTTGNEGLEMRENPGVSSSGTKIPKGRKPLRAHQTSGEENGVEGQTRSKQQDSTPPRPATPRDPFGRHDNRTLYQGPAGLAFCKRSFCHETSLDLSDFSDTEETPITYTVVDNLSPEQEVLLRDSQGYAYCVKRQDGHVTYWTCSMRTNYWTCRATIKQRGTSFTTGPRSHKHLPHLHKTRDAKLIVQIGDSSQVSGNPQKPTTMELTSALDNEGKRCTTKDPARQPMKEAKLTNYLGFKECDDSNKRSKPHQTKYTLKNILNGNRKPSARPRKSVTKVESSVKRQPFQHQPILNNVTNDGICGARQTTHQQTKPSLYNPTEDGCHKSPQLQQPTLEPTRVHKTKGTRSQDNIITLEQSKQPKGQVNAFHPGYPCTARSIVENVLLKEYGDLKNVHPSLNINNLIRAVNRRRAKMRKEALEELARKSGTGGDVIGLPPTGSGKPRPLQPPKGIHVEVDHDSLIGKDEGRPI